MATDKSVTDLLAEWDERPAPDSNAPPQAGMDDAELSAKLGASEPEQPETSEESEPTEEPSEWDKIKDRLRAGEYESTISELRGELSARDEAEALRVQHAEWDRAADTLLGEGANVDRDVLKKAILGEYMANEEFAEAFENRAEDPGSWKEALEELGGRLPRVPDSGLFAAVRSSRFVDVDAYDASDYGDWAHMSDAEFRKAGEKLKRDMAAGKIRPAGTSHVGGKFA